jgi:hypothetical protein
MGKSAQALLAAVEPVLVIAPAMVLDGAVWDDEVTKWTPGKDVTQVPYSMLNVRERTDGGGNRPTDALRPEFDRPWGTVILDESQYVKGRKTYWTKAVKKLQCVSMTQLTGTPIPNWAQEAFIPLQLMWPEKAAAGQQFGSYWRWAAEWFTVAPKLGRNGNVLAPKAVQGFRDDTDAGWAEFREQNWGDRMLLRLRENCLDLPPLTIQEFRTKMVPEQARVYRALKNDFVAWLESGIEVAAWNQAAQMVKLAKCATGVDVLDPSIRASGKLDALRTLLSDRPRPTLVVAHFQDSVAACARTAAEAGKESLVVTGKTSKNDRRLAVRAFQSGNLGVLCASIGVISEGLTMTAADQVIRVERHWLPSKNEQVLRRLHRIGQTRPVLAIDLVASGTLEPHQNRMLASKTDQQIKALGIAELRSLVQ